MRRHYLRGWFAADAASALPVRAAQFAVAAALCVAARLRADDGGGDAASFGVIWHSSVAPRSEWLLALKVGQTRVAIDGEINIGKGRLR